jgi:hypothetical protein
MIIGGDSYDHYWPGSGTAANSNLALARKYDVVGVPLNDPPWITPNASDATQGRFASNALRLVQRKGSYIQNNFPLPAPSTLGFGFALKAPAPDQATWPVLLFRDNTLFQVSLNIRSDLHLEVWNYDGSNNLQTQLGSTSSSAIAGGTFSYVEFKVTFHPSAGAIEVRIDGTTVISASGVATRNPSSVLNYATNWLFGKPGLLDTYGSDQPFYIDDLIAWDTSGALHNDFIGDCHLQALLPDADGPVVQWTPNGAGSNYLCVNENPPDDDTTYVEDSVSGDKDLYHFPNVTPPDVARTRIIAVLQNIDIRKTGGGSLPILATLRSNAGDHDYAASLEPGSSYHINQFQWETDPDTGVEWDITRLNDANAATRAYFGQKLP